MFDFRCTLCSHLYEAFMHARETFPPCKKCGYPRVERIWQMGSAPAVKDDSIPGGMVIENLSKNPETFYSYSDYHRRLKELGVEQKVRHVGTPGSDKSPHTQRWISWLMPLVGWWT